MDSDGNKGAARRTLLLVSLVSLVVGMLIGSRVDRFTESVWRVKLVARCEVHYHEPPFSAVALACPGVDYLRLSPLPMIRAWPSGLSSITSGSRRV